MAERCLRVISIALMTALKKRFNMIELMNVIICFGCLVTILPFAPCNALVRILDECARENLEVRSLYTVHFYFFTAH